jgi:hypothetical protein
MSFPPFPTQSLYGAFPPFPIYVYSEGWNIAGTFYGFSITLPNLIGIPAWTFKVFEYFIGWIGAFFLWAIKSIVVAVGGPISYLINLAFQIFTGIFKAIELVSSHAGIFSPIVASALVGLLMAGIILGVYGIANLLKGIGGAE